MFFSAQKTIAVIEYLFDNRIVAAYLSLACAVVLFVALGKKGRNLPPGKRSYSLLGDALEIKRHGMREVCRKYRQVFGNIFTLRIVNTKFIVCCGYENLNELLVQNRHIIMKRLERPLRDLVFGKKGVIATSGEIWKRNKLFALQTLKDFGLGKKKLETKILKEVDFLLDAIDKTNGEAFDIAELFHRVVSNVMASFVFGERFELDDREFEQFLFEIGEMAKFSVFFKYPWQRYIPGDPFRVKEHINTLTYLREFYVKRINRHFKTFKAHSTEDFIDVYIKHMKDNNVSENDHFFNEEELVTFVHDLFSAGTETTALALRWGLIFLMRDDTIQSSIHNELDSCIPSLRYPSTSDKTKLQYFHATTQEILRRAIIVPFVGRILSQEVNIKGYTFPKSANILMDIESTLMDSELWDDPQKFNPSRFLGNNAGSKIDKLLTFSTGPRACLGESVARMELFLFLAAMLQRYKFLPPVGEDPPSLNGTYGVTHTPNAFKVRAIRRTDTQL